MLSSIIFVIAFFLRLYNIALLPINYDEAPWARCLLEYPERIKTFLGIPATVFHYRLTPVLEPYLPKPASLPLSAFVYHVRFTSILAGALAVVFLYLLVKEMYGKRTALIASLFLCFLPWQIMFSRIAGLLILLPLFGILIFFCLLKGLHAKNIFWRWVWFLLFCFFLKESLYSYRSAVIYIPIAVVVLLSVAKEIRRCLSQKEVLIFCAIALITLGYYPHLIVGSKFSTLYYNYYHKNPFVGDVFANLFINFSNNALPALYALFFNYKNSIGLYTEALRQPLLIHPITFFLLIGSMAISFYQRKPADRILLVWFIVGFLGGVVGINFFEPRYIFIILIPAVILIARGITSIFEYRLKVNGLRRHMLLSVSVALFLGLLTLEMMQWNVFYWQAPFDLAHNVNNSWGSKEAAEFLLRQPDIRNCRIMSDDRMNADVYLNYYMLASGEKMYYDFKKYSWRGVITSQHNCSYRLFWAKETHPRAEGREMFLRKLDERKLNKNQLYTIYYPSGETAIYVYRVGRE